MMVGKHGGGSAQSPRLVPPLCTVRIGVTLANDITSTLITTDSSCCNTCHQTVV